MFGESGLFFPLSSGLLEPEPDGVSYGLAESAFFASSERFALNK